MTSPPFVHNPTFNDPRALVAGFVVRDAELAALLEALRENTRAPSIQHVLVVGARGMGKTTLLQRVAAEVERAPDLAASWHVVRFGEEAYTVASVGELWLEALQHIAEDTGLPRWREVHAALAQERDPRRLQTLALARLLDFADEAGRRLVLVVENLQMLLDDAQIDRTEAWALRHTLQTEPRLMLLASATARVAALGDPRQALYELFKVHTLGPLDDDATRRLWAHVAGQAPAGERIRPVRILTGGNPRMIARMATHAAGRSQRELMDDVLRLVDDHTTYFKALVEELPIQERRVFVHLADLWAPATARDLAARARMDVSLVSANLKRLVQRGLVSDLDPGARVRRYEVAERMFNLYHLLRSRTGARARVTALVAFMARFYEPDEGPAGWSSILTNARGDGAPVDLAAVGPSDAAWPLVVARRLLAGEPVNEPREVLAVAADVTRRLVLEGRTGALSAA